MKKAVLPSDNRYMVYSDGRIFSKINKIFLKQQINHKGYPYVLLNKNSLLIHRAVAICFVDNPYNLPQVNHEDGNKLNNNYKNLSWVTPKQNKEHAMRHGLFGVAKGSKNGNHRLSEAEVIEIKNLLAEGKLSQWQIANKYSVWQSTISAIKCGTLRKDY